MPMAQTPFRVVPDCCAGISISVSPDGGREFRYPMLGIERDEVQSKVAFVFMRKMVGIFALAAVSFGEYPPFTRISTTCLPFATDTLSTFGIAAMPAPESKNIMAPPMSTAAAMIEITIGFIWLEVKDRRYEADDRQTVDKIEERKHDYDESCCLEEYARAVFILNAE